MKNDREDMVIMPVTLALKPLLSEEHKLQRVLYCLTKANSLDQKFHDFYNYVHVDEKWFFISEEKLRCYIAPDEVVRERTVQNKDHILKVMFLCAVARPRYAANGDGGKECIFDGKVGLWPFVESVPARRRSINRPQGALVTTSVSCTKERYRAFLMEHVLPSIKDVA
jgi:hypothetical protein